MSCELGQIAGGVVCRHYVFLVTESHTSRSWVPVPGSNLYGALVLVDLDLLRAFQALQIKLILGQCWPFTGCNPWCSIVSNNCGMLTHVHLEIGALLGAEAILDLPDVGVPTVRGRHCRFLILTNLFNYILS